MTQMILQVQDGSWTGMWEPLPAEIEGYEGFVYEITCLENGKKYIGKKSFWNYLTLKPLKGKKQQRHVKKESDWKAYYGSSKQLLEDLEKYGKRQFERKVLQLCKSKWELSFYEAKHQFLNDVIFRNDYYNGILNLRVPKAPKQLRY